MTVRPAVLAAIAALALPGGASDAQVLPGPVAGIVERVVDGDTLAVRVEVWIGQELQVLVRLRGVDAPEARARCAAERELAARATAALGRLAGGRTILLHRIEGDKYFGRVVADVTVPEAGDLGAALIAAGLVRRYDGRARGSWCGEAAAR